MPETLLQLTPQGLYCPAGDFFIDPWQPVARAVITHAHSDHARPGMGAYLTVREGEAVLRARLGPGAAIQALAYAEPLRLNGVELSLYPAGHILGAAQVRVAHRGEVWVVSGDYKTEADPTCAPFEPVRCHTFVTEATFGLPIYRWRPQAEVLTAIEAWWRANQDAGRASLLFGYALGKAQRLLAGLDPSIGPIFCHGAVERFNTIYRAAGATLPPTTYTGAVGREVDWSRALIIAPPSAQASAWTRRFGEVSTAFASGWMRIRGARRRRAVDRGFVLSDHADWPGLLAAIAATGAERVWVTHGYSAVLARWLTEQGLDACPITTRFEGEQGAATGEEE
ncbi:MAG: ligase-associated DNA damage response exonuclease [Chloroflexaceae bacterium]|nr:ligase-associated DNA damage response exonuclease [Chloroflexaceae bacterium]